MLGIFFEPKAKR
jgi:hypothetical protein